MTRTVLSLGANLGDRAAALQAALDALAARVPIVAVSPVYATEPLGYADQPEFLNAVALVDTDLPARDLLSFAHQVEQAAGRVRGEHWGPRTLDVDLVAYGSSVSSDPECTLPHPRAHERAFVLVPWLDVDPSAVLPAGRVADLVASASGAVRRTDHVLRVPS